MAEVYTLDGDNSKTPEEALKEAAALEWQDVVCVGYGSKGELQVVSSHIDNSNVNLLVDILKVAILKPFITGEAV